MSCTFHDICGNLYFSYEYEMRSWEILHNYHIIYVVYTFPT